MDWIKYPENKPADSRTYLISIQRQYAGGDFTFKYVAYYNATTGKWHKSDGFDNDSIKEIITDKVTAWIEITPYLS